MHLLGEMSRRILGCHLKVFEPHVYQGEIRAVMAEMNCMADSVQVGNRVDQKTFLGRNE